MTQFSITKVDLKHKVFKFGRLKKNISFLWFYILLFWEKEGLC